MYVIYFKDTTRLVGKRDGYETESAAKAALTRESKKPARKVWSEESNMMVEQVVSTDTCAIAERTKFHSDIEKTKTVYSIMDKNNEKPIVLGVNTPAYMDPSCESYWSM